MLFREPCLQWISLLIIEWRSFYTERPVCIKAEIFILYGSNVGYDANGLKQVCPDGGMVVADKGYCVKPAQDTMKA